jgi:protein SCO1/2
VAEQSSEKAGEAGEKRSRWGHPLVPLAAIAAILVAATLAFLLFGGSGSELPNGAKAANVAGFEGEVLKPRLPAPETRLLNYTGQPVSLGAMRGKPLLVTFLYTHCPDVCPLIASNLGVVLKELGPRANGVNVVAISVDPKGDTPATVAKFLGERDLNGKMDYLIGNAQQLGPVWEAWNVGSERDAESPEFVAHSALVYGVSASGRLVTIYPANFKPSQIVHDLPKLAQL